MTTEPITLEYKVQSGQIYKYKTIVKTDQETTQENKTSTQTSTMEMAMTQKVVNVSADGTIQLDITIESGNLVQNNQTKELPTVGQTINMTIKKNGEIVSSSVKTPFTQHAFPSHPVKIGDTWTGETSLDFPGRPQPVKIQYLYTFEGLKNMADLECAQIKVECPSSSVLLQLQAEQSFQAQGHTFFAFKKGFLVKSELETKTKLKTPQITMQGTTKAMTELIP